MIWTTEKPTQAGYYWYRYGQKGQPRIEQIVQHGRRLELLECGNDGAEGVPIYDGEWAGPLEPPT